MIYLLEGLIFTFMLVVVIFTAFKKIKEANNRIVNGWFKYVTNNGMYENKPYLVIDETYHHVPVIAILQKGYWYDIEDVLEYVLDKNGEDAMIITKGNPIDAIDNVDYYLPYPNLPK